MQLRILLASDRMKIKRVDMGHVLKNKKISTVHFFKNIIITILIYTDKDVFGTNFFCSITTGHEIGIYIDDDHWRNFGNARENSQIKVSRTTTHGCRLMSL